MPTVTFERITVDVRIMGGVPCVLGTRIPVSTVMNALAEGFTFEQLLIDFPQLTSEDICEVLRYAVAAVEERDLPLHPGG